MISLLIAAMVWTCVPDEAAVDQMDTISKAAADDTEPARGFRKGIRTVEAKVGRVFGTTQGGSDVAHDLWVTQLQFGLMLSDVLVPDQWFAGNFEGTSHLLLAAQDNPDSGFLTGLDLGLRYHFLTRTRFVPFLAGSIGVGVTDIGAPDLSGKFQFNEQIGVGMRYFVNRTSALGIEYSLFHVSNGGIRHPNGGITAHVVSLGLSYLF